MTDPRPRVLLPTPAWQGRIGVGARLIFLATRRNPLPTSPCGQGERSETSHD